MSSFHLHKDRRLWANNGRVQVEHPRKRAETYLQPSARNKHCLCPKYAGRGFRDQFFTDVRDARTRNFQSVLVSLSGSYHSPPIVRHAQRLNIACVLPIPVPHISTDLETTARQFVTFSR